MGGSAYLSLVGERWCYLATWLDAYSRHVARWYLTAQMPTELVLTALEQALTPRQPRQGSSFMRTEVALRGDAIGLQPKQPLPMLAGGLGAPAATALVQ